MEMIQIKDGRLVPLCFTITTNFIWDQLETKTKTYVKFHDYAMSSSTGVVRRTKS